MPSACSKPGRSILAEVMLDYRRLREGLPAGEGSNNNISGGRPIGEREKVAHNGGLSVSFKDCRCCDWPDSSRSKQCERKRWRFHTQQESRLGSDKFTAHFGGRKREPRPDPGPVLDQFASKFGSKLLSNMMMYRVRYTYATHT